MTSQEFWGMVYHGTKEAPIAVAIQHIAFTTEIADETDLEQEAESVVSAMDAWWDNVRSWLEVITGQHLTHVGHQKIRYIGNPTPVWTLLPDGAHGRPVSIGGTASIQLGRQIHGVTVDVFRDCVSLADQAPKLAWILLRDARSLAEAGQHRRAVIDAATAAEVAVTTMMDSSLSSETQSEATRLRNGSKNMGRKLDLLASRGHPLPQSLRDDLVDKRNEAVHEGMPISPGDCRAAIAEALAVVETAFPLPTPPGASQPLRRLW
jgi:hypothetical protein